jgi:DNA-3-methyladenine glycosylase II
MSIKGIGPWTANIYLLMALRRPDAWPSGDLAVKKAIEDIKDMSETPSTEKADDIAQQWKPWRAVATRILWHHYLNRS